MENKSCVENGKNTESRVKMLQDAWPTGDVVKPGAIDWHQRVKASIQTRAKSKLFLAATVFVTIAAIPFIAISPLCPLAWMAVGLWMMYTQAKKGSGEISEASLNILMFGLYFNFAVGAAGTLIATVLLVEGCTDAGRQNTDMQNILFWVTFLDLGVIFLIAFLRWKVATVFKTIKKAYEGTSNDGMISVGAIASCFVLGGIAWILVGILLALYRKDMIKLEEDMLEEELKEAERTAITPTWKLIEESRA